MEAWRDHANQPDTLHHVEEWSAEEILQWAVDRYHPRVALTCSFGGAGTVLAHMLARYNPEVPILFLDTGYHFPETLAFKEDFTRRYQLRVMDCRPASTVAEQDQLHGAQLYQRNPDLCCRLRKVAPMEQALQGYDAWIAALRREQAITRRNLKVVEHHRLTDGRQIVKIHPLAGWSRRQVWAYIRENGLPYHPLLDEGYTSIGCAPCTRPILPGESERAGRWAGQGKTECGLHTFTDRDQPP